MHRSLPSPTNLSLHMVGSDPGFKRKFAQLAINVTMYGKCYACLFVCLFVFVF